MSANQFSIYSEDLSLLGMNSIKVQAFFTEYTSVTSGTPTATQIELIDPCLDPFTLTVPTQNTLDDYYYTEDAPILAFTTQLFTVEPSICQITYSCAIETAGIPNICDIADG